MAWHFFHFENYKTIKPGPETDLLINAPAFQKVISIDLIDSKERQTCFHQIFTNMTYHNKHRETIDKFYNVSSAHQSFTYRYIFRQQFWVAGIWINDQSEPD